MANGKGNYRGLRKWWGIQEPWEDDAACASLPKSFFLPNHEPKFDVVTKEHREVCGPCPVREKCLNKAIMTRSSGIWAATTERDRKKIERQKRLAS